MHAILKIHIKYQHLKLVCAYIRFIRESLDILHFISMAIDDMNRRDIGM